MYITKLYGDGKPLDNVSFKRVDISALHPAHPVVRVADYIDARIEEMVLKTEKNATINSTSIRTSMHTQLRLRTSPHMETTIQLRLQLLQWTILLP